MSTSHKEIECLHAFPILFKVIRNVIKVPPTPGSLRDALEKKHAIFVLDIVLRGRIGGIKVSIIFIE